MKVLLPILLLFSIGMSLQGQKYWVDDACHVERGKPKDDFHGTWAAPHNKYGVKCCLWDKCKNVKGHGCTADKDEQVTYSEAVKICKQMDNMHVCTKEELLSDMCCYTGGKCNDKVVWTSTTKESEENPQILEDSISKVGFINDDCNGIRESTCGGIYFVPYPENTWNKAFEYKCPDGLYWLKADEYDALVSQSSTCENEHIYYNQCGWDGYNYNNQVKHFFRFSDSNVNDKLSHSGVKDTSKAHSYTGTEMFAGIVCGIETYWADDACHTDAHPKDDFRGRFMRPNEELGVKCCSNTEAKCIHGYTCNTHKPGKTYKEAVSLCEEKGDFHVCTKDELLSEMCCETGGLCDHRPVWTSTRGSP